jgi:hypothetical protein
VAVRAVARERVTRLARVAGVAAAARAAPRLHVAHASPSTILRCSSPQTLRRRVLVDAEPECGVTTLTTLRFSGGGGEPLEAGEWVLEAEYQRHLFFT